MLVLLSVVVFLGLVSSSPVFAEPQQESSPMEASSGILADHSWMFQGTVPRVIRKPHSITWNLTTQGIGLSFEQLTYELDFALMDPLPKEQVFRLSYRFGGH